MDKVEVPFLAPGCFGSALIFKEDDMVCPACPFMEQCKPVHEQALEKMRDRFGIEKKSIPVKKQVVTSQDHPERMTLPKKVRGLLKSLDGSKLNIVGDMKNKVNPFRSLDKMRYMQVVCHLVMHLSIPVTQKVLAAGLRKQMNWSEGTANAHARMSIQALEHVGAIENNDGTISVKKD